MHGYSIHIKRKISIPKKGKFYEKNMGKTGDKTDILEGETHLLLRIVPGYDPMPGTQLEIAFIRMASTRPYVMG